MLLDDDTLSEQGITEEQMAPFQMYRDSGLGLTLGIMYSVMALGLIISGILLMRKNPFGVALGIGSGGGRNTNEQLLLSECSESIKPYGVIGHRHTSEIESIACRFAGHELNLQFTPNLVPMARARSVSLERLLDEPSPKHPIALI